jgi:triosephosphate isomerase
MSPQKEQVTPMNANIVTNPPMRITLIVGNWKMHKTLGQARADMLHIGTRTRVFDSHASPAAYSGGGGLQTAIAPVDLHLASLAQSAPRHLGIYAQNVHWESHGAFTGEHSASMLADIHVKGSIVAHSERRQYFGETNRAAGLKIRALLGAGLHVIYCVGESAAERDAGLVEKVLETQICEAIAAAGAINWGASTMSPGDCHFNIAYEPVWAIGTGKAATEVEAQHAHEFIRKIVARQTSTQLANAMRILYGGSVNPANISRYLTAPDIDGALVGGASLSPESFEALCKAGASHLEKRNI